MKYSELMVRPELTWEAHRNAAPEWLEPYLDVPDDAQPPMAATPIHADSVGSYGVEAVGWIERELNVTLRWWQRYATVRQLEHDEVGRLLWSNVIESASRRAGKSLRLRGMALWRLAHADLFGEPQLAIHTGKDLAIVREIQRGAWRWAEQRDWRVVRAIGRESIEHDDDRWLARATDSVYGYDITLGMVDESWAVEPEIVTEGMEPATLERVSPQVVLTSTAHRRATALMPGRIRDALIADDESTLLLLWSAPDGADMSVEETWRVASPFWSEDRARLLANKYRKALAGEQDEEFDDVNPMVGFASQYLNRWRLGKARVSGALPHARWLALQDASATQGDRPIFALDVTEERQAWVAMAWSRPDGARQVILANHGRPMPAHNAVAELVTHAAKWKAHVVAPPGFVEKLEAAGVKVIKSTAGDFAVASGEFADAVTAGTVRHGNQLPLNDAVRTTPWRNASSQNERAFLLSEQAGPLAAATRAVWGLSRQPSTPVPLAAFA